METKSASAALAAARLVAVASEGFLKRPTALGLRNLRMLSRLRWRWETK